MKPGIVVHPDVGHFANRPSSIQRFARNPA
jgi:hypothetical protein